MICIYHNRDLDGYCSGAIVKKRYPDCKLIGYDYGLPFPWDDIPEGEEVIMVDVSLPMKDMQKLALHTRHLFKWIDHHKSAIDDFMNYGPDPDLKSIQTKLQVGHGACELAWEYLFPTEPMPLAVLLLGQYDTWRNEDKEKWEHEILPFQFGMREICNSPETFPQVLLGGNEYARTGLVKTIISDGKLILSYQETVNQTLCKKASFEMEFEGLRAICLNGGGFNSDVFKSVYDPAKHDVMMPFQFNGKFWVVSLYTTKPEIDCSVLAKKYGGGGHKGAAGFQLDNLAQVFFSVLPIPIPL